MSEGIDVEPTSRVAARRKAREQAEADDAKGAVGGSGGAASSKPTKSKGGRFGNRNTREKRRGTGVVKLQDDAIEKATADVKETTAYNEEITKPSVRDASDHCGNGCSNGATVECTNGSAADVCSRTPETQESPRQRRQQISNSDETESHHNARRRQPEEIVSTPHTTPTSILRRAEARASTDGRSPEEWRRMYEREHRENRRLQRRLADSEKTIASLKDELYLITEELETVEDELDSVKEENRQLVKAIRDNKRDS